MISNKMLQKTGATIASGVLVGRLVKKANAPTSALCAAFGIVSGRGGRLSSGASFDSDWAGKDAPRAHSWSWAWMFKDTCVLERTMVSSSLSVAVKSGKAVRIKSARVVPISATSVVSWLLKPVRSSVCRNRSCERTNLSQSSLPVVPFFVTYSAPLRCTNVIPEQESVVPLASTATALPEGLGTRSDHRRVLPSVVPSNERIRDGSLNIL